MIWLKYYLVILCEYMKRYSDKKPISSIIRRESKIDPRPEYQRSPVWSNSQTIGEKLYWD